MPKPTIEDYNKALATILEYIAETVVSRVNSKLGSRKGGRGSSNSGDAETLRKLKFRVKELVDRIGKEKAYKRLEQENAFYSPESKESDLKKTVKVLEDLQNDNTNESNGIDTPDSDIDTPF